MFWTLTDVLWDTSMGMEAQRGCLCGSFFRLCKIISGEDIERAVDRSE